MQDKSVRFVEKGVGDLCHTSVPTHFSPFWEK